MSSKPLSVAVIGAGMAGRAHANGYRQASTVFGGLSRPIRLAAIADLNLHLAQEAADLYGYETAYDSWERVVEDPSIDAVSVVLGNALHRPVVEALLNAGKHVLCEKPLADSLENAEAMVRTAEASQLVAAINYSRRSIPSFAAIKRDVENGLLGKITDFQGYYWCDYGSDPNAPWTWRDSGLPGSGALGDIGAHIIDQAEQLCGPVTRVSGAELLTAIPTRRVPLTATVGHGHAELSDEARAVSNEDAASFSVRFANGAVGSFSVSRVAFGSDDGDGFTIAGLDGSAVFDWRTPAQYKLNLRQGGGGRKGYRTIIANPDFPYYEGGLAWNAGGLSFGYSDVFVFQARAFLDQILGSPDPLPPVGSFAEGLHTMKVIQAIVESAETGSAVEIGGE